MTTLTAVPDSARMLQWFELWCSRAEAKFQAALARHDRGEGSEAEFAGAEAERDQVLLNYQHGTACSAIAKFCGPAATSGLLSAAPVPAARNWPEAGNICTCAAAVPLFPKRTS
jgi:hypothetical protein